MTIRTTHHIYELVSKTHNGSIPITNQPQGCSFTNGFCNVSLIQAMMLIYWEEV